MAKHPELGACTYCRRKLEGPRSPARTAMTKDHVMPKCVGGVRKVRCCRQCNQLKGDLHPTVWRWFTEAFPGWWKAFETNRSVVAECRKQWGGAVCVSIVGRASRGQMEARRPCPGGESQQMSTEAEGF